MVPMPMGVRTGPYLDQISDKQTDHADDGRHSGCHNTRYVWNDQRPTDHGLDSRWRERFLLKLPKSLHGRPTDLLVFHTPPFFSFHSNGPDFFRSTGSDEFSQARHTFFNGHTVVASNKPKGRHPGAAAVLQPTMMFLSERAQQIPAGVSTRFLPGTVFICGSPRSRAAHDAVSERLT
jgi:hypothetical protein